MVEMGKISIRNFFEHRMTTYAEQLSYRGLFGLFPFIILVFALLAVLQVDAVFDRLIEAATAAPPQQGPESLEPVAEEGRAQTAFLRPLIEQAREQAGRGLLSFGIVVSLWSVSAVAFTLTEALSAAYGVEETRSRRKRFAFALVFGPFLALAFIVACGLMLIGPRVAGWLAGLAGLDEAWVALWAWLRLPVGLFLLAAVLSIVYHIVPDTNRSFWSETPGALFAVIAWAITSLGFSFFLANFAGHGLTYGSLGTAVGLLVYLYLSASVVLLGAEINAAVYRLR
ncbi:MAG TPA: YihY/virulence factor BrkB family protein [Rubrobacter sp.]|jgi:membrane protein|nr:YihY/virulence factor BrkB family protein [Rubrobacter sp.]